MKELIKVTEQEGKQLVSARDLYLGLGYRAADYSRWCKTIIINNSFFIKNEDWVTPTINDNYSGRGQKAKEYLISTEMAKAILLKIKHKKKSGEILKQLESTATIHHTQSRFENSFGYILIPILKKLNIDVEDQYHVDKYRIDFYLPKLNIAIEYDEIQHYYKSGKISDRKRQAYIEKKIKCKFVRLDYRLSDAENVGIVLKEIFINKQK
ncbi:MAG: antA/AntB antirepressor family protein [Bacteroidales bacterium]